MSEWQPIETAPTKNKACILVWDGSFISIGEWFADGSQWIAIARGKWADDGTWDHEVVSLEPTHWMPLPEPPQKTETGT